MKLLLDANISWRLCASLAEHFGECLHVNRIGLPLPPTDIEIWEYAKINDCVIVSHDTDFTQLFFIRGQPPKIIFLKTGNISTATTLRILIESRDRILEWAQTERGMFEITLRNPSS